MFSFGHCPNYPSPPPPPLSGNLYIFFGRQKWIYILCFFNSGRGLPPPPSFGQCPKENIFSPWGVPLHCKFFVTRTGFAGFPGSGNTMMRLLLEAATGGTKNINEVSLVDRCSLFLNNSFANTTRNNKFNPDGWLPTEQRWWDLCFRSFAIQLINRSTRSIHSKIYEIVVQNYSDLVSTLSKNENALQQRPLCRWGMFNVPPLRKARQNGDVRLLNGWCE